MEPKLILGDCIEGLKDTPDKFYDLAIVDPPYGINSTDMNMGSNPKRSRNDGHGSGPGISTAVKDKKNRLQRLNGGGGTLKNRILNTSKIGWDYEKPSDEYFIELFRVSKNQIIWGGNYFDLGPTRCVLCWDKRQPWENFSQWEMAWTSFDSPAAIFSFSNTGGNNFEKKIHPTQKPKELYKWVLNRYAQPGDKILDTHGGSMSSVIACLEMGFEITCYEKDPDYFKAAVKRIEQYRSQLKIFQP
jgi:site-specific DNA-methyltransferase (adenine-specific)